MMKIINGPQVTAQLSAALKDISRLTGFSEKEVTRGEAGQILKTWAGRTKVAKPEQIDLRTRKRILRDLGLTGHDSTVGQVSINAGVRGPAGYVWVKTRGLRAKGRPFRLAGVQSFDGSTFRPQNTHWKADDWESIQGATNASQYNLAKAMPLARASAGLARQSVIQIADSLGIRLESVQGGGISAAGISKARNAMASNGKTYVNGTAQEYQEAGKYFATLIERLPYWPKIGMDRTLAGVLAGRVGLYRRTFAGGAYRSVQSAARNYPWMRTSLSAAA